ncbi:MAG: enoyl-CoA hydratase/isomerase family protein [Balneolaceae bacterium]|nr:enoyl-CoA hydratase/isomerase family protein [Balneolaceae bacterium]
MSLKIDRERYVVKATINRPDSMNAINFDLMERLEQLLTELEHNDELRLFILTGSGGSFISGGDLREFHTITDADGARQMSVRMTNILKRISILPCWTLAAINGHAYGGGWETLLCFDFAVATRSAKFGFTQGKFYLPPGWGGLTRLSRTVGKKRASYWLASQKVISSTTALQAGLIQDLFEDDDFSTGLKALTERLTLNDRSFIRYMKQEKRRNIADELEPFSRFWESEEHINRVEQFLDRKKS